MAKNKRKPAATTSRLFVLALGLLVGFVIAFVMLLSRLPVDGIISQYNDSANQEAEVASMNFDYYSVLQEQEAGRKRAPQIVAVEPPMVFMEPPREIQPQYPSSATSGQVPDRPLVRQQVESDASVSVPAPQPAPTPVQPRVTSKIEVPARVQVQPRVQPSPQPRILPQPELRPEAPARVPVKEILASERGLDSYYVEAGNYRENNEALRAQATLRGMGLDPFIVVRQDSSGAFGHRVRIGPFFDQSRLNATRKQLRDSGVTPKLIRVKGS